MTDPKVTCGFCNEQVFAALLPEHFEIRHPEVGYTAESFREMARDAEIVEIEDPNA